MQMVDVYLSEQIADFNSNAPSIVRSPSNAERSRVDAKSRARDLKANM